MSLLIFAYDAKKGISNQFDSLKLFDIFGDMVCPRMVLTIGLRLASRGAA
jgi:hypothetical protein